MNRAIKRAQVAQQRKAEKTHNTLARRIQGGLDTLRGVASLESGIPAAFVGIAVEGEAVKIWDTRIAAVSIAAIPEQDEPEDPPFTPTFAPEAVTMADLMQRIDEYGACHIVVSDGNLEDDNIAFCLGLPECTEAEAAFLRALVALSMDERETAYAIANGHIKVPAEDAPDAIWTGTEEQLHAFMSHPELQAAYAKWKGGAA